MVETLCLYLDESGARHPDKRIGRTPKHGHDWFGVGGILFDEKHKEHLKKHYDDFCNKHNITSPLRSADIRAYKKGFSFIGNLNDAHKEEFFEDLYQLMNDNEVIGFACVIDRPGYKTRYEDVYGDKKWLLCKTAFSVVVERAAKYAKSKNKKLRVYVEQSGKKEEAMIKQYYETLKNTGMPFDNKNSSKYAPLTPADFDDILYDLKFKSKKSKPTQLADLYLWPMCIGGYHPKNKTYQRLLEDKKLINCHLEEKEIPNLGIKYSCWEQVDKNNKTRKTGS